MNNNEKVNDIDVHNYLIDPSGKDWAQLLSDWSAQLPPVLTVWLVNRFGDVCAIYEDGSVHMLDVGTGVVARVADSREHFCSEIDRGNNANNWLMIPLVDRCVTEGLKLDDSQCYGYKVPPVLGGEYDVRNFVPTDLSVHYSLLADIHRQIRDLPDGTKVRIVTDRETNPPRATLISDEPS